MGHWKIVSSGAAYFISSEITARLEKHISQPVPYYQIFVFLIEVPWMSYVVVNVLIRILGMAILCTAHVCSQ